MRQRLNTYRDRGAVIELLGDLVDASGALAKNVPGVGPVGPALAKVAALMIVKRLRTAGWPARLSWRDALAWFGHRDQGLHHDPVRALIRLSVQAQSDRAGVRYEVDDLLVGALLADMQASLDRVVARPWNAVVVLDNSDAPMATWFVTALVRVRQNLAARGAPPDPVTVVAASGGSLATSLVGQVPAYVRWRESQLASLTARARRRFRASFQRTGYCVFWRFDFRQYSFHPVARAPQRIAPYAWTRPLICCHANVPLSFRS
jgi:hypothetical protein